MALFRQRNTNTNTLATLSDAISLNSSTSTKIVDSCDGNGCRIFFGLTNNSNSDIWLKLQAATTDNDKKGIFVPKKSYWEMPPDNIYSGEISAIADFGTPDVYYTQY